MFIGTYKNMKMCYDLPMNDFHPQSIRRNTPEFNSPPDYTWEPSAQSDAAVQETAQPQSFQEDAAPVQPDAGAVQDDAAVASPASEIADDLLTVSVDVIRLRLEQVGISKSKDTVQRYFREGRLTGRRLGLLRRYFASEESAENLIETLQKDAAAPTDTQVHAGADDEISDGMQVDEAAPEEDVARDNELHAAASADAQVHAPVHNHEPASQATPSTGAADTGMQEFLKDQLRVKDEKLKVKDEQIAAMLERDRETNILIRELQGALTSTVQALPGVRDNQARDAESRSVERKEGEVHNPQPDTSSFSL